MKTTITRSKFNQLGVFKTDRGFYVGVSIPHFKNAGINLYDVKSSKLRERIEFDDALAIGDVYCLDITGIDVTDLKYRFFADDTTFLDKYVSKVIGNEEYGKRVSKEDLFGGFVSKKISKTKPLCIPYNELIMSLIHPRGFSMGLAKAKSCKGTFKAVTDSIDYFLDLGINALVFMPVNEYIESPKAVGLNDYQLAERFKENLSEDSDKVNFWGYDDSFHFAIKESYGMKDASTEFAYMVEKLHENGIECIVQMYFRNTDDILYIIDSLVNMVSVYGVDGFRLLGNNLPIHEIITSPYLSKVKIMADADFGYLENAGQKKTFKNLCLYNDKFMTASRKLLKGDEDQISYISYAVRENHKMYALCHYISDYYGFTLWDLVSYNRKHNEDNGENNEDGSGYNYSWNCGEEGPTSKRSINVLRRRQARNAMLLTLLSQATPVIRGGDEILNTQNGNNNPYCQDNEIGWIKYQKNSASNAFYEFTKNAIAFRKRHCILHQPSQLRLTDYLSCKMPDVSFHGEQAFKMNQDNDSREFAVLYAGDYARQYTKQKEESIMIIYNLHWEDRTFSLPFVTDDRKWRLLYSTDGSTDETFDEAKAKAIDSEEYIAKGRTISVLLME